MFLETKGGKIPPAKQELPANNEKKIETGIPKIDPPAAKPEPIPTKEPNTTLPTNDSTPNPNLPQENNIEK
jgi:hypothetical protein